MNLVKHASFNLAAKVTLKPHSTAMESTGLFDPASNFPAAAVNSDTARSSAFFLDFPNLAPANH